LSNYSGKLRNYAFVWNIRSSLNQHDFLTQSNIEKKDRVRLVRAFSPVIHWRCVERLGKSSSNAVSLCLECTYAKACTSVGSWAYGFAMLSVCKPVSIPTSHKLTYIKVLSTSRGWGGGVVKILAVEYTHRTYSPQCTTTSHNAASSSMSVHVALTWDRAYFRTHAADTRGDC
jgi:hypothetical protein